MQLKDPTWQKENFRPIDCPITDLFSFVSVLLAWLVKESLPKMEQVIDKVRKSGLLVWE
jgi:hypothetical protein